MPLAVLWGCRRNEGDFCGWVLGGSFLNGSKKAVRKHKFKKISSKNVNTRKMDEKGLNETSVKLCPFVNYRYGCCILLMHLQLLGCCKPRGGSL